MVSAALGTPRSTLQHWVDRDPVSLEPVPSPPPPARATPASAAAARPPLPPIPTADIEALAAFLPLASRHRKGSAHAAQQAAQICDEIVLRLASQGYSPTRIAADASLPYPAVKSRLQTARRRKARLA